MKLGISLVAFAMALVAASAASAETITGRVVRVDPATRIIEFDDGRSVKLGTEAVLLAENRAVALEQVQPGASVVVVETRPPAATVVTPASPPPAIIAPPVVTVPRSVSPPPGVSPAPQPSIVARAAPEAPVIHGTVARAEPNGTLVLTDGRTVHLGPNAAVVVEGRHVASSAIQPGAVVMVEPKITDPALLTRASVIESDRVLVVRSHQAP